MWKKVTILSGIRNDFCLKGINKCFLYILLNSRPRSYLLESKFEGRWTGMMKGYCNSAMCVQVKLAILKTWWKWEKKGWFLFWDRVSLCSIDWPGTPCVDQAGLFLPPSAWDHHILWKTWFGLSWNLLCSLHWPWIFSLPQPSKYWD